MLDPVETVNARLAGANINTVFEVMQNAPEAIGVLDSSAYDSVDDLAGTTVGLVSDRDRAFLQASLSVVGKSIDDVQTVVLGESGPTLAWKAAGPGGQTPPSLLDAARDGLLMALLNPKVGLFFLALFSQFVQEGMSLTAKTVFVSTIAIVDGAWYVLVAAVLSQGQWLEWLRQHQVWVERILGVILILLALRIFLE